MNENDFKERKTVVSIRSNQIKSEPSLDPTPGPRNGPRPRPVESIDAKAEILFANAHGWKLVRSFVTLGSVAKVSRCYSVRCATVEQAILEALRQRRVA